MYLHILVFISRSYLCGNTWAELSLKINSWLTEQKMCAISPETIKRQHTRSVRVCWKWSSPNQCVDWSVFNFACHSRSQATRQTYIVNDGRKCAPEANQFRGRWHIHLFTFDKYVSTVCHTPMTLPNMPVFRAPNERYIFPNVGVPYVEQTGEVRGGNNTISRLFAYIVHLPNVCVLHGATPNPFARVSFVLPSPITSEYFRLLQFNPSRFLFAVWDEMRQMQFDIFSIAAFGAQTFCFHISRTLKYPRIFFLLSFYWCYCIWYYIPFLCIQLMCERAHTSADDYCEYKHVIELNMHARASVIVHVRVRERNQRKTK